ncbi:MAG TPA: lycopene cyclase domain-containing protein [Candidatus Saccharimonadales bacterium]|jgi:lycopene cyclase domain-containing protein
MATYVILNLVFLVLALLLLTISRWRPTRHWLIVLGALLLLTAVFDSLAIWLDFFSYEPSKRLGIDLGLAPIEDYIYSLVAALLIPALWQLFGTSDTSKDTRA